MMTQETFDFLQAPNQIGRGLPKLIGIPILLAALAFNPLRAADLDVAGTVVRAPTPKGFALLTPDIQPLYDVSMDMVSDKNIRLATFVDENIIPVAIAGEYPAFERYINVEVMRDLAATKWTKSDFAQMKRLSRDQIEEAVRKMEDQWPNAMESLSNRVSETLDLDVVFSMNNVVPLPVHFESDAVISNSMIAKMEIGNGRESDKHIVTATTSFVFVRNKILFIYVYGGPNDLDWTRATSREWINLVLTANEQMTSRDAAAAVSPQLNTFNWQPIIEKGMAGAVIGGFLGLIVAVWGWLGKKLRKNRETQGNDDF
jgi:hypothetical protein